MAPLKIFCSENCRRHHSEHSMSFQMMPSGCSRNRGYGCPASSQTPPGYCISSELKTTPPGATFVAQLINAIRYLHLVT